MIKMIRITSKGKHDSFVLFNQLVETTETQDLEKRDRETERQRQKHTETDRLRPRPRRCLLLIKSKSSRRCYLRRKTRFDLLDITTSTDGRSCRQF